MDWLKKLFEEKKVSDKELQSELKALCKTVYAKQYVSHGDSEIYKKLLAEIYKRGLEPEMTINFKN